MVRLVVGRPRAAVSVCRRRPRAALPLSSRESDADGPPRQGPAIEKDARAPRPSEARRTSGQGALTRGGKRKPAPVLPPILTAPAADRLRACGLERASYRRLRGAGGDPFESPSRSRRARRILDGLGIVEIQLGVGSLHEPGDIVTPDLGRALHAVPVRAVAGE